MLPERVSAESYKRINEGSSIFEKLLRATVVEHQARYKFASRYIGNTSSARIIDAACGSGWGVDYLAKTITTSKVIGLDIDNKAIEEAMENFNGQNIEYIQADLLNSTDLKVIAPADWIICFEFLEHVPEDQAQVFLENLRETSVSNGRLIISTPNRALFSPFEEEKSSFSHHSKEYTPGELVKLLQTNGWGVDSLYGQLFVNPRMHLQFAKGLLPLKKFTSRMGIPEDHRLSRLPISLLHRLAVLQARDYDLQGDSYKKQPLFMTAICSRT